jgi:hypothetical protein
MKPDVGEKGNQKAKGIRLKTLEDYSTASTAGGGGAEAVTP